jgi:hypothetical protein
MNHDRPSPVELLDAAHEFIEAELLPVLSNPRLRFRTLVALNALAIASRELRETTGHVGRENIDVLARQIREGDSPANVAAILKQHVAAKLRVSSPGYLDRYEARERAE